MCGNRARDDRHPQPRTAAAVAAALPKALEYGLALILRNAWPAIGNDKRGRIEHADVNGGAGSGMRDAVLDEIAKRAE